MKCGSPDDAEVLLLCDGWGCNAAIHTFCLTPPLARVPAGEWYCASCTSSTARAAPDSARAAVKGGVGCSKCRYKGCRLCRSAATGGSCGGDDDKGGSRSGQQRPAVVASDHQAPAVAPSAIRPPAAVASDLAAGGQQPRATVQPPAVSAATLSSEFVGEEVGRATAASRGRPPRASADQASFMLAMQEEDSEEECSNEAGDGASPAGTKGLTNAAGKKPLGKAVVKKAVVKENEADDIKFARPPGRPRKGKVWSAGTGEWVEDSTPDADPAPTLTKKWPRPRGAARKGCTWDYEAGVWVPTGEGQDEDEPPAKRARAATDLQSMSDAP